MMGSSWTMGTIPKKKEGSGFVKLANEEEIDEG